MSYCETYEQKVKDTVRRLWWNRNKPDLHSFVADYSNGRLWVECVYDGISIATYSKSSAKTDTFHFDEGKGLVKEVADKLIELEVNLQTIEF